MEIIVYVLIIVLVLVVSRRVTKLKKATDEDRHILLILAKDKVKKEMGGMVENFHKGLENLFNPKDNKNGKNSKKVNDKNKHQN